MDGTPETPQGLPQYMQKRVRTRSRIKPFFLVAVGVLALGAAWGAYQYALLAGSIRDESQLALMIEEQRTRFMQVLSGVSGLTMSDIASGFWFTYIDADGNEHVLYFDPVALARQGLSDAELQQLRDVIAKSSITHRSSMRTVSEDELPPELRFHNIVYSLGTAGDTTLDLGRALSARVGAGAATSEELFQLSYLYELEGRYADRDRLNRENCERFRERCSDDILITVSGRVLDTAGAPVSGAYVTLVSRDGAVPVVTNAEGRYQMETGAKRMEKMRFRATKQNYSDGFANAVLLTDGVTSLTIEDIEIKSPVTIVTIDYGARTVTGDGNEFLSDGGVIITTPQSRYEIPAGAIVMADRGSYTAGPIDVYLYEFTKEDQANSLLNADTFDQVMGFAGDLMKTFGMPYIQFFTQGGVELHVLKSKPMILTYAIPEMEALRTNQDEIYEPLTEADMRLLVQASAGNPYRIDREFLINNQLLRFPAFWVFDRNRGVWDNVGVSVLDTEGTIRTIFYTLRDDL